MYKSIFITFFIAFLLTSCVKGLDFSQTDDFEMIQPIDMPFVYFNFNQTNFIVAQNNEIHVLTDKTYFRIGSDVWTKIRDKIEIEINTSNSFDRGFTIQFDFYDVNNVYLFQKSISVSANSQNVTQTIVIEGEELYLFRLMYKVQTKVILLSGDPIQSNVNQIVSLKSALHFDLNYTSN